MAPELLDEIVAMPAGSDMDRLILEHVCLGNWDGESNDFSTNDATALDLLGRIYYFFDLARETLSEGMAGEFAGTWGVMLDYVGGGLSMNARAETLALAICRMLLLATKKYGYLFDEEWPRDT